MQRGSAVIFVLIAILILAGVAGGAYYFGKSQTPKPQPQNQNVVSQALRTTPTSTPSSTLPPSSNPNTTPISSPRPSPSVSPIPTKEVVNASLSIKYSPMAGWQTYTDEVAGFSFQYNTTPVAPYNSHQSMVVPKPGKSVTIMGCNTPPSGPTVGYEVCTGLYEVMIYSNYNGGSRREWYSQNLIGSDLNCQRYYMDLSMVGKNALLATGDCGSWGETSVIIPNGAQIVLFTTSGYSHNDTTGKITLSDYLQKALSTFKFTN